MVTAVIMPRQGQSVESCIITEWKKKVGDKVAKGDVLFSYETDKSSFDEASEVEGTLLKIFAEEGDDVPCLNNVCLIGEEGDDISGFTAEAATETAAPAAEAEKKEETVAVAADDEADTSADEVVVTAGGRLKISPRAKLLALKTNADLFKAVPTGAEGRIIERDVQKLLDQGYTVSPAALEEYLKGGRAIEGTGANGKVMLEDLNAPAAAATAPAVAAAPAVADYTDEKIPNIRKVIAKSMHASLSEMAQLTLNASFDASKMLAFRASLKANGEAFGMGKITINDMVLFAAAKTLLGHRAVNAHYLEKEGVMRYFNTVNLGVAVDTERGLLVPTVFGADKMSLSELSKAAKTVISAAQGGTINPDLLKGASFTVTNLGSMGIESFTPVINPPQTAILGVCASVRRSKLVDGKEVFYPAMGLSLTFDHRALDGAPAARFLKELCTNLENFDLLLAK